MDASDALKDGFNLLYQPITEITTGKIFAAEALLRTTPGAGALHENSSSEETLFTLERRILRTACEEAVQWQKEGLVGIGVHVNFSPRELRSNHILEAIEQTLQETGLDPSLLVAEITETSAIDDPREAERILEVLKSFGVGIWLDDFGSGHSSMVWLRDLRVDGIKIPKMLIDEVMTDARSASIVRSLIELAHELEMRVIAEGVEVDEQVEFLRVAMCDAMQGFYLAHPVSPKQLLAEVGRRQITQRSA